MNFLINLFKKAKKGDNFRTVETPNKYNDNIAQLNTANPNQYTKLNTNSINKIQKTNQTLTQSTSKGSTLPS